MLCLGVSYASLEAELNARGHPVSFLKADLSSSEAAIEAVRHGLLMQMDGRDLARCLATEAVCDVDVYCVSQEKGAIYRDDRHFEGNFNRPLFVKALQKHFNGCRFDTIILDYFWMPAGWDQSHWNRSFFENTLVAFAQRNLLTDAPSSDQQRPRDPYRGGVVYLPFCLHCFREVIAAFPKLKQHYNVSFVGKQELEMIALWVGTRSIDAVRLQDVLGKRADQEEVYCKCSIRDILGSMEYRVSQDELLEIARSLENMEDIRFIALERLCTIGMTQNTTKQKDHMGCFLGLTNTGQVSRNCKDRVIPDSSNTAKRLATISDKESKRSRISPALNPCHKDGVQ